MEGWCDAHHGSVAPNRAAWHLMTVAERAKVLVFYLKEEAMNPQGSKEVIDLLLDEVNVHQQFLGRQENFSANSNHGLMEAIGFLETARVYPDARVVELGLSRLETIVTSSDLSGFATT